jgi:hypothetical protein
MGCAVGAGMPCVVEYRYFEAGTWCVICVFYWLQMLSRMHPVVSARKMQWDRQWPNMI